MKNDDGSRSPLFSILYYVLKFLNYMQMLIVMSFNVWLIFIMALSQAAFQFLLGLYEDSLYITMLAHKI